MKKPELIIVRTIPIEPNRSDIDFLIIETQESLRPNEIMTLPLKKVSKFIDQQGEMIKVLDTEINVKKEIRIIQIAE